MAFSQGVLILILMGLFITAVFWAWSDRRRSTFDEAARLPLEESEEGQRHE